MNLINFAKNKFKDYGKSAAGSLSIYMAVGSGAVLIAVAAAVEMSRLDNSKTELQDHLDAAILGGAAYRLNESARVKTAEEIFAGLAPRNAAAQIQYKDGVISGTAALPFTNYFGSVLPAIKEVEVKSAAGIANPAALRQDLEVALALDFSDSMYGTKLTKMKSAVNSLLADLNAVQDRGVNVKVGLVPFHNQVLGTFPRSSIVQSPQYPDLDGDDTNATWTGCTGDRNYPANTTLDAPIDDQSKWGVNAYDSHNAGISYWCDEDSVNNNLEIIPLTRDIGQLKAELGKMEYGKGTHVQLGLTMGGHVLSPGAPFENAAAFGDKGTKKYLVLLTDGEQTRPAFGPNGSKEVADGPRNFTPLCNNIKAKGITVAIITYDLTVGQDVSAEEKQSLMNCASSPSLAFNPNASLESLTRAFDAISYRIVGEEQTARLLR